MRINEKCKSTFCNAEQTQSITKMAFPLAIKRTSSNTFNINASTSDIRSANGAGFVSGAFSIFHGRRGLPLRSVIIKRLKLTDEKTPRAR